MPRHYVTFGQGHTHRVNGYTLDCNSVASFEAKDYSNGREKAVEYFGDKFFTDYHDKAFNMTNLHWWPRGIINIDDHE